jgi:hypothetical protein
MTGDCILWTGCINASGYGVRRVSGRTQLAHRVAFAEAHGPIPEGLTVDHLCFTRSCVRVDHMRLLTAADNQRNQRSAYKTHCVNGHEFTPENTIDRTKYRSSSAGRRSCRQCTNAAARRYQAKKRAA